MMKEMFQRTTIQLMASKTSRLNLQRCMLTSSAGDKKIVYTHGHAAPVVQNHASRTCEDFAPHVVQLLSPGDTILDVGCGPGSITKGFRKYVGPAGRVVGIDLEKKVLEEARKIVGSDAEIAQGDVYNLPFQNKEFDVVHAHQVLQHIKDPVSAIKEMKRVSNHLVACREVDYESWLFHPISPALQQWKDCYRETCRRNKADPDAGRKLKKWFLQAGFHPDNIRLVTSTVTYASPERTRFISESWANRVSETQVGDQMISYGLATKGDIENMAKALREWGLKEDAVMFYVDVSVVGRVG